MSGGDKNKEVTCHAIDACTTDQVIDIFEESFGYLSFVDKFVNRIRSEPIDYTNDTLAASTKPLIVLDIDNTILFVRYFGDEICVKDRITYYHNAMDETEGVVTSVWYRLKLELSDDELIDEYGTDMIEFDHCHTDTNRLKKRRTFNYPYKIDEKTNEIIDARAALIKDLTVIGCEIEYELQDIDIENNLFHKFISFEEDSIEIENFLPSLQRKGYADAAFVYDGFLVRIRNGVEDFLDALDAFDIVFFTAANRAVYEGLMKQLHAHLRTIMGRDDDDEPLWKHIFFRDDCTYDFDERGRIYHHKDLTKYNKDLSKVIIVDNSALSYKSLEPNAILIKDFFGKDTLDDELDIVLELTDEIIDMEQEFEGDDIYVDYRYILTKIVTDASDWNKYNDLGSYNRRDADDILLSTQRFLNDLKESLMERGKLPTTLKFGEPTKPRNDFKISYEDLLKPSDDKDAIDAAAVALPAVSEGDETPPATTPVVNPLQSSFTEEIKENEGSATPKGNYALSGPIAEEQKDIEAIEELQSIEKKEEKPTKPKESARKHTFSISIRLSDIPNFAEQLHDESGGGTTPLDVIMQNPDTTQKFSVMNELEMMQNITRDEDLESVSAHNDGIGSRMMDDTDDDSEDSEDESDWDDIEEEEEEKEMKIEAPPPRTRTKDKQPLTIDENEEVPAMKPEASETLMAPKFGAKNIQRRFSSMKPRPNEEQIASGMSSVFLKRSVSRLQQFHEKAQRRSSLSKSSKDLNINHDLLADGANRAKFGALKDKFEQQIAQQTKEVRRDSLRGNEAKEELEKLRQIYQENEEKSTQFAAKNTELKILKVDNPWVAKLQREGIKQPRALAQVMRNVPKSKAPRRLKRRMNSKQVIETEEEKIVSVDKRVLPPAPIRKRQLPQLPTTKKRAHTVAHLTTDDAHNNSKLAPNTKRNRGLSAQPVSPASDTRQLFYQMDKGGRTMTVSFGYTVGVPAKSASCSPPMSAQETFKEVEHIKLNTNTVIESVEQTMD